jgi:hypothetical protein
MPQIMPSEGFDLSPTQSVFKGRLSALMLIGVKGEEAYKGQHGGAQAGFSSDSLGEWKQNQEEPRPMRYAPVVQIQLT